jgi:hypothetical protein
MFILPINRDNDGDNTPWAVITLVVVNSLLLIVTYAFDSNMVLSQPIPVS